MSADFERLIKGRLTFMAALIMMVSVVMVWRLFDIQVVRHEHYLAQAQDQQRFEKIELAERGRIYVHDSYVDPDRYYPLAFDVKRFAVWVVPRNLKDKTEAARRLAGLLALPENEIFSQINNDKIYIPPVKRGLSLDEANRVKGEKISGVLVVPEYSRYYPEATLASHLLGFVNAEGDGKYGFEGHYNGELKGLAGEVRGEKDTLGRVINLLEQKNPRDGTSYVLTIDRSVQFFVEKKLSEGIEKYQADSASAVILDIETGGVVAMASRPTYDPNNFREQAKADAGLFVNPVIAHLYEPGSVFKPMVMSAALDAGAVTPETKNTFGASAVVDGYEIHTAENKAFGEETMSQIIVNSDNVGMVWVSEKLGKEKLYDYIKKYGFFEKTGIDLDTEVNGYSPPLKHWRNINRATIAFGQGISITPLGLAAAYATLANGGVYIYPRLVDKMILPDGTEKKIEKQEGERVVKTETAKQIAEMLVLAVDEGHGWRAGVPGYRVAGKTGTAQIPKPEGGYEELENGLGIFNHSFAGFAPADSPKYAMVIKLEKPKTARYAENTSAELFGEISSFLLNYYYRVPPTR
ncbi:MAG: penicillin-binding protein 2 [Patescibacteria group bacterium]